MKKIKRTEDFQITVDIQNDEFIKPPRSAQRNVVLNKAIQEMSDDLTALDKLTADFVSGKDATSIATIDRASLKLSEQQIMEDWQIPVMQAMANAVCSKGGDILEIGFGRGISASMIQQYDIRSHTIIECNDAIIEDFYLWKSNYNGRNIDIVKGLWQESLPELGKFDGIFFHTYPLNQEEYMEYVIGKSTFAEHFFEHASDHLNKGAMFTYFSNEIDSLSRSHQRALLKHFSGINIQTMAVQPPEDVHDTFWSDQIVIVNAMK